MDYLLNISIIIRMKKFFTVISLIFIVVIATGAGYVGTLPNIEAEFEHLREEASDRTSAPFTVQELDKKTEEQLKPIPRQNDDYVDIIIKKDKTTKYLKDVNSVILILEKLRKCLNTDRNIQMFNAIVSNLIDNIEYVRIEYKDKPESNYLSYSRLINVSNEARDVATFRMQGLAAEKYRPYTSENNIHTKEALDAKMESLLNNVNETLFILKNLD